MSELPKRLLSSFGRIQKRGGIVLVHHAVEGGATTFCLQDGGGVSPNTVTKLIDAGLLVSGSDGLLAGCEQTFHCRGGA